MHQKGQKHDNTPFPASGTTKHQSHPHNVMNRKAPNVTTYNAVQSIISAKH